jgi:hypothetical protein
LTFFSLDVHQHVHAQLTTNLFVSSMELGQRSPRNAFCAAREKNPFDRANGDI